MSFRSGRRLSLKLAVILLSHLQGRGPLLGVDAITLIHNAARGYPRAVNNLAVHALTAAFAEKTSIVDTESGHH